jgi:anti-anti-sigma factor
MPLLLTRAQPRSPLTVVRVTDAILTAEAVDRLPRVPPGHRLLLDLGAVRLPSAGGLGRLVTLSQKLKSQGGRLILGNVPAPVHEVLQVTRLTEVLDVRPADVSSASVG